MRDRNRAGSYASLFAMQISSTNGLDPTTGTGRHGRLGTQSLGPAPRPSLRDRARTIVLDRISPQLGAFTWYRYALTGQSFVGGPARFLNIGTGGGIEALRLLRKGNHVTTIEIDSVTAARTRARIERNGFGSKHVGHAGHVLSVNVVGPFDGIVMCEVLEHIKDDVRTLERVSQWLAPGGRLIMSTPTASYGQLPGDEVSLVEDGGHVRVGYDGPELDLMLADVGIAPIRRIYLGHRMTRWHIRLERLLQARRATVPIGLGFSLASRPFMPLLDSIPGRPLCQLTVAIKKHSRTTDAGPT
jgi:SAM-dependent methyltransferase